MALTTLVSKGRRADVSVEAQLVPFGEVLLDSKMQLSVKWKIDTNARNYRQGSRPKAMDAGLAVRRERIAGIGIARLKTALKPLHTLLGGPVSESLRVHTACRTTLNPVVADRRRSA